MRKFPRQRGTSSARAVSKWHPPGQPLPYRRKKPPLRNTSIPPEELGYGDDEPEEDASDTPRASGSSFDEIDDACKTAKNPDATQAQREKAAKVFSDMEGTELYEKMMEGSSEIGIRIKGLIEIRLKKPEKEFVVPDNIEDFDIRNYV